MKYLKYFETEAGYASYKNGSDFITPNVSYVFEGSKLFYNPYSNLKNGTIYATFNATSDNMVAIYDTSNVKSLIVDDKEISFDITEGSTIINIIGENITMNDDMYTGTFPEEYCYMLSNGLPSSWTFKPTNASIDECNYIALIGIFSGQMMVSPMPINTGIEQGFFTYDNINNVFCVSGQLLGEMSQEGIEGLNFVCVKMDEVNGTFTFLDTTHDIEFRSGGKPTSYIFNSEGNHTMEIELINNTTIPQTMFFNENDYNGTCITTITIPDSVTSIGNSAFRDCTSLTSIIIPDSVTSINNETFWNCSKLTSITIPDSVTSIGKDAFRDCTSLTSIIIPDSVTSIGNSAFKSCFNLTSITIPNSVTYISDYMLNECSNLTSITIPDSVTSIGNSAFSGCKGLTSIVIPNSVNSIGNSAFSGCKGLTEVTIGSGVTSIDGYAFSSCSSLNKITCLATRQPLIHSWTFNNIAKNGTLYIPVGSSYSSWMSTGNYYLGKYNWTIEYI